MPHDITKSIQIYQEQLTQGDIQRAYVALIKYLAELKANFPKKYKTGNISPGYLDYSYFPFFNDYLRANKLRFGVVLNHRKMQFELWLMGQNKTVQTEYWEILKQSQWNQGITERPIYSVLEVCLEDNIDFNNKDEMTASIFDRLLEEAEEIQIFLKKMA